MRTNISPRTDVIKEIKYASHILNRRLARDELVTAADGMDGQFERENESPARIAAFAQQGQCKPKIALACISTNTQLSCHQKEVVQAANLALYTAGTDLDCPAHPSRWLPVIL